MFNSSKQIKYRSEKELFSFPIDEISQGFNQLKDFFILREDDNFIIYDRKCDHNGGKLCVSENSIICPLHNWEFDINEGEYTNKIKKKKIDFLIQEENIVIEKENLYLDLPSLNANKKHKIKLTFFSHACLIFESKDFAFATDPWIKGFAFSGGWWIDNYPPKKWIDKLNSLDFIYISHNHPDHLNEFTLSELRKDMPFIVPNFVSKSVEIVLRKIGFKNIYSFNFQKYYKFKDTDLLMTILKSGDFRDDSGLYFSYGDFSFLTSVDSNDLNFSRHPKDVTVYASNFAGGASGFPLCFDTLSEKEKEDFSSKNRKTIKAVVSSNVRKIMPKFFLPYAGFFYERAKRDKYIAQNNLKNSIEDFYDLTKETKTLNLLENDELYFENSKLTKINKIERENKFPENPEKFMEEIFQDSKMSDLEIKKYFQQSGFQENLILHITLNNSKDITKQFIVDFSSKNIEVDFKNYTWPDIKKKSIHVNGKIKALELKIREDSFYWVLSNKKSWEDLSIGFQCRIDRVPDVYNVNFWFHFTNIYI